MRCITALFLSLLFATPAQAEILIGIAGPLSGQNAAYGNELRTGVAAAVGAVNAAGGINGETLTIIEGDDACDAKRAVDVSKTFVSRDVRMVVGHFCTSASLAAASTYEAAGILMLNPSVTSPELTSKKLWNVFRLTGRDDAQAEVAAARIKAAGQGSDVYMVADDQSETAEITKRFLNAIPSAKTITLTGGSSKIPDDPGLIVASAIYFALQAIEAAEVAKSIRKSNPTAQFYGPDFLQSESFGARGDAAANGTLVTFLQDHSTTIKPALLATLTQRDGATLAAYAAVEVFVAAAKAKSVNDARAMATWLSSGNEIPTVIGNLRFNPEGDLQQQPYQWYRWTNGILSPE